MPETGVADRHVQSVGSYLRGVRESRGLQLEEAATVTRIGKNYLIAIEEEMFDKLPNPAYVKGFLRVYAGYLGLSGDEIVAMYEASLTSHQSRSSLDAAKNEPPRVVKPATPGPGRWMVPLLLLVIVATTAYFMGGKGDNAGKGAPAHVQPPMTNPPPVEPARVTPTPKAEPAAVVSNPPQDKGVAPAADQPHTGIILRLKVNQDCWLNITIDNAVSQQYDLKAGDLIEWKGERVFTLDLGNAGGIEAEFNGKPLKPFGEPGTTAHVVLKADGS